MLQGTLPISLGFTTLLACIALISLMTMNRYRTGQFCGGDGSTSPTQIIENPTYGVDMPVIDENE